MPIRIQLACCLAALTVLCPTPVRSEAPRVLVEKGVSSPVIDGLAEEAFWDAAPRLGGFSVFEPRTGLEPRFGAWGKVMRDGDALYVYLEVGVGEERIFSPMLPRDDRPQGDRIELRLDTEGVGRRAYVFEVGASGSMSDARRVAAADHRDYDSSWDSLFSAATRRWEDGWAAEIRIPFQSLRFDPEREDWGLHIFVKSWDHQQGLTWAPLDRDMQNWIVQAGRLQGMGGLRPGRDLEFNPSLTGSWERIAEEGSGLCELGLAPGAVSGCGGLLSGGMGVKWAVTPSLTLDAVFNPDFSQVEADAAQLTINNRFPIRLEERRPFFVEGGDIFALPFEIFYSRSIHQPETAVKLSQAGKALRFGALVAWDGSPPDSVADEAFSVSESPGDEELSALTSVARVQRDLGSRGSVGAMVIDRGYTRLGKGRYFSPGDRQADNQVLGADGEVFLTPQLKAEVAAFVSQSRDLAGSSRRGQAAHGRLVYREDTWRLQGHYRALSDGFRSEAGYLPRRNFHNLYAKADYYYRSENDWGRFISPGLWVAGFTDDSLQLTERIVGANTFWRFGNRMWVIPVLKWVGERVDGQLHESRTLRLRVGSASTVRWLEGSIGGKIGETVVREDLLAEGESAYVGWMVSPSAVVVLRPREWLSLHARYAHRVIYRSRGGEVLAEEPIVRLTGMYFFQRDLHLRYVLEWRGGEEDAAVSNDLLLNYEPSPGTVLYLGYRESVPTTARGLEGWSRDADRSVFLKMSMLWSL